MQIAVKGQGGFMEFVAVEEKKIKFSQMFSDVKWRVLLCYMFLIWQ